jgi:hypothetical protein
MELNVSQMHAIFPTASIVRETGLALGASLATLYRTIPVLLHHAVYRTANSVNDILNSVMHAKMASC